ncbi:hypothetical protein UlMin_045932 [Ulmus minor]
MKVDPHRFLLMFGLILLCRKATSQSSLSCNRSQICGSIEIPYPFGTSLDCAYDSSFLLTCNQTLNSHKLFFPASNVSILSISTNDGELRVEGPVARHCYNQQGNSTTASSSIQNVMIENYSFPLSPNRNKFTVVGCNTLAVIAGRLRSEEIYADVCYSSCIQAEELKKGSCSGIGCCQTNIPEEVYDFALQVESLENYSKVSSPYKRLINHRVFVIVNLIIIYDFNLSISVGLLLLVLAGSWINWNLKKRKLIQMKEKLFQQNGGLILQQQLFHHRGSAETAKIFTAEELRKATNNYDETRVLGQGGYGKVYRGVLTDDKVVAIKKSKIGNQAQIEQFINEVVVLSQINHRNVVKLLGCCLETEVPLLVYEFIINGTLSDHVHEKNIHSSLPWEMRLKIGTETAGAIAYLHSSTVMPIIHRDIKSTNILLDENYTAKVADFGASRLIPLDQTQLTTLVQGTLGYLDPEYFQTSQLTEKSDVYSFGVVLAELLTGEKAISFDRQECDRNLAMHFISSVKEERFLQILDKNLIIDGNVEQLKAVANVALSCLRVRGADRPTMKEVAGELEGLKYKGVHPWRKDHDLLSSEETESLLEPSLLSVEEGRNGSSSSISKGRFDSMSIEVLRPYDDGVR